MLSSIRAFLWRLTRIFCRQKSDDSFCGELEFHLQMEAEENIHRGMSPTEAERRARMSLGGLEQTKEVYRDMRWTWLDSLWPP